MKFEYITRYFGEHDMPEYKIVEFLNIMGEEEWELVQIIRNPFIQEPWRTANYTFIFKRGKSLKVKK